MVRFLALVAAVGTTLALANPSDGGTGKGSPGHSTSHSSSSGHQTSHSVHSYSSHYRNWSSWSWNSRYGCYFYCCPTSRCDYYWYAPASCYYPVTCLAQYPPTQCSYQNTPGSAPVPVSTPIQVTNTTVNTLANGAGVVPTAPIAQGILPKGP